MSSRRKHLTGLALLIAPLWGNPAARASQEPEPHAYELFDPELLEQIFGGTEDLVILLLRDATTLEDKKRRLFYWELMRAAEEQLLANPTETSIARFVLCGTQTCQPTYEVPRRRPDRPVVAGHREDWFREIGAERKVDSYSRIMKSAAPVTSDLSKRALLRGGYSLTVLVDESGRVERVWAGSVLPLDAMPSLIETISQWQFEPAIKGGQPVKTTMDIMYSMHPDED